MTNHIVRLYALSVGLVVFFVTWAAVAAHPWQAKAKAPRDPRLVALAAREKRLRHDALTTRRALRRRWAVYQRQLQRRRGEIEAARRRYEEALAEAQLARARAAARSAQAPAAPAAAPAATPGPSVRVVTLPPLVKVVQLAPVTVTKTS